MHYFKRKKQKDRFIYRLAGSYDRTEFQYRDEDSENLKQPESESQSQSEEELEALRFRKLEEERARTEARIQEIEKKLGVVGRIIDQIAPELEPARLYAETESRFREGVQRFRELDIGQLTNDFLYEGGVVTFAKFYDQMKAEPGSYIYLDKQSLKRVYDIERDAKKVIALAKACSVFFIYSADTVKALAEDHGSFEAATKAVNELRGIDIDKFEIKGVLESRVWATELMPIIEFCQGIGIKKGYSELLGFLHIESEDFRKHKGFLKAVAEGGVTDGYTIKKIGVAFAMDAQAYFKKKKEYKAALAGKDLSNRNIEDLTILLPEEDTQTASAYVSAVMDEGFRNIYFIYKLYQACPNLSNALELARLQYYYGEQSVSAIAMLGEGVKGQSQEAVSARISYFIEMHRQKCDFYKAVDLYRKEPNLGRAIRLFALEDRGIDALELERKNMELEKAIEYYTALLDRGLSKEEIEDMLAVTHDVCRAETLVSLREHGYTHKEILEIVRLDEPEDKLYEYFVITGEYGGGYLFAYNLYYDAQDIEALTTFLKQMKETPFDTGIRALYTLEPNGELLAQNANKISELKTKYKLTEKELIIVLQSLGERSLGSFDIYVARFIEETGAAAKTAAVMWFFTQDIGKAKEIYRSEVADGNPIFEVEASAGMQWIKTYKKLRGKSNEKLLATAKGITDFSYFEVIVEALEFEEEYKFGLLKKHERYLLETARALNEIKRRCLHNEARIAIARHIFVGTSKIDVINVEEFFDKEKALPVCEAVYRKTRDPAVALEVGRTLFKNKYKPSQVTEFLIEQAKVEQVLLLKHHGDKKVWEGRNVVVIAGNERWKQNKWGDVPDNLLKTIRFLPPDQEADLRKSIGPNGSLTVIRYNGEPQDQFLEKLETAVVQTPRPFGLLVETHGDKDGIELNNIKYDFELNNKKLADMVRDRAAYQAGLEQQPNPEDNNEIIYAFDCFNQTLEDRIGEGDAERILLTASEKGQYAFTDFDASKGLLYKVMGIGKQGVTLADVYENQKSYTFSDFSIFVPNLSNVRVQVAEFKKRIMDQLAA